LETKELSELEEIRLRLGQPLLLRSQSEEYSVNSRGVVKDRLYQGYITQPQDIHRIVASISDNSLYAFEEELSRGFITIPGGHRVGLAGRVILKTDSIRMMKDFSGIAIRIAREVRDCSLPVLRHIVARDGHIRNALLISPPRCGKTTILRDLARHLSVGGNWGKGHCVTVVDERSELAGCYRGAAQFDLGPRTDVLDGCPKASGMIMAIRSLSPQVIITDEIGRKEDIEAVYECINAGVGVIASVHAGNVEEVKRRPWLRDLVGEGGFAVLILLSRRHGPGTVEEVVRWDRK